MKNTVVGKSTGVNTQVAALICGNRFYRAYALNVSLSRRKREKGVVKMGSAEKIRIMRVKNNNMSERDLAQRMGDTPQNLNNKMKRNDFNPIQIR